MKFCENCIQLTKRGLTSPDGKPRAGCTWICSKNGEMTEGAMFPNRFRSEECIANNWKQCPIEITIDKETYMLIDKLNEAIKGE